MAEEEKQQNTETEKKTPSQEDLDALRAKLDKQVASERKAREAAESRAAKAESQLVGNKFKVDLPDDEDSGLTDEQRKAIQSTLTEAQKASSDLAQLVPAYLAVQAKAQAYELAVELEALDEVEDIESRLKEGRTPRDMETLAKEIRLEFKEAAVENKSKNKNSEDKSDTSERKFDEGGGQGAVNQASAIRKQIDEISINSSTSLEDIKEAEKKLDSLYLEATKGR